MDEILRHYDRYDEASRLAEPMGAEVHLNGTLGAHSIIARVSPRCRARPGERLTLTADLSMAHLFDKDSEKALGS